MLNPTLSRSHQLFNRLFHRPKTNPWSRDTWNVTEQGQVYLSHGTRYASKMAAKCGLRIGQGHPEPSFLSRYHVVMCPICFPDHQRKHEDDLELYTIGRQEELRLACPNSRKKGHARTKVKRETLREQWNRKMDHVNTVNE